MLTAYEHRLIVRYLANLVSCLPHRGPEAKELVEWVASNGRRRVFGGSKKASRVFGGKRRRSRALPSNLGRKRLDLDDLLAPEDFRDLEDCADGVTGKQWSSLKEALRSKCSATKSVRSDRTAQRLRCLGRTTGLSRTDVAILELMLRYQTQPIIESMIDNVFQRYSFNLRGPTLSALLGVSANAILDRLRTDAPLVRSGLVCIDSDDGDLTLVNRLHRLATIPGGPELDVNRLLLGETSPSELEWPDFDHLGHDRDHVERLLGGALETGAPGVNVLLYGPPGTGKTEFCKVLAGRLGVDIHSVGESDEDGAEPTRHERLQELRLAQRLIARGRRSLLLFDEMEDLLSDPYPGLGIFGGLLSPGPRGFRAGGESKVFMNRLLEGDAGADPVDHQRCPHGRSRRPAPDDVRLGAAPAAARGEGAGLDAAACAPRYRGGAGRCVLAGPGVRGDPRGGGRGHRRRAARRRRPRSGAPRRAQPVPGPLLREAAAGDAGPVRPRAHPGRHRSGEARGPSREQRRAALLPLPARAAGHGQERVRALPLPSASAWRWCRSGPPI